MQTYYLTLVCFLRPANRDGGYIRANRLEESAQGRTEGIKIKGNESVLMVVFCFC